MVTVILKQPVSLRLDPDVAKWLGLPESIHYRKGANQIPDALASHWAIKANMDRPNG